jgi:hypothetical protein
MRRRSGVMAVKGKEGHERRGGLAALVAMLLAVGVVAGLVVALLWRRMVDRGGAAAKGYCARSTPAGNGDAQRQGTQH